jgi:hypothetical protein
LEGYCDGMGADWSAPQLRFLPGNRRLCFGAALVEVSANFARSLSGSAPRLSVKSAEADRGRYTSNRSSNLAENTDAPQPQAHL